MIIRAFAYMAVGLILVVLNGIASTRLGWSVDIAWIIVAALAFSNPPELSPIAGLVYGLILDGLTGSMGFYTIAYSGFGAILMVLRRVFYLNGFMPGWILAIVGAELLWLFFVLFSRAIQMLGGYPRNIGLVSPFLLSTLIGFPVVYWLTKKILFIKSERSRRHYYGATTRIIDKT